MIVGGLSFTCSLFLFQGGSKGRKCRKSQSEQSKGSADMTEEESPQIPPTPPPPLVVNHQRLTVSVICVCGHVLCHADERGGGGLRGGVEDSMGIEGRRESDWGWRMGDSIMGDWPLILPRIQASLGLLVSLSPFSDGCS